MNVVGRLGRWQNGMEGWGGKSSWKVLTQLIQLTMYVITETGERLASPALRWNFIETANF